MMNTNFCGTGQCNWSGPLVPKFPAARRYRDDPPRRPSPLEESQGEGMSISDTALYGEFGSVCTAPPLEITCNQCGHTRQVRREVKQLNRCGAALVVVFDVGKDDGCPECACKKKRP